MTGHDNTSGSLRALAVHLHRLGLRARLGSGPCPALEVSNPLSAAVSAAVGVGEPRAAASRLGYLLGLIRT